MGGYDQLCCPASPKLLLGLDLGLGCDNHVRVLVKKVREKHFGLRVGLVSIVLIENPIGESRCSNIYPCFKKTCEESHQIPCIAFSR